LTLHFRCLHLTEPNVKGLTVILAVYIYIYHRILAFRVHINGENHSNLTVNTSNSCR